ncbi:MAG: DUF423 domain-containing protein [Pseudomonadota bacterium]
MILTIGALFGFIAVAFGAFAEHGLRENISEEHFRFLMTALRYNQIHAVLICGLGIADFSTINLLQKRLYKIAKICFITGTALFSFSIYISISCDIPVILYATPVGGITLMLAWISLSVSGLQMRADPR